MMIDPQYWWLGIGFALICAEVLMGNFILFFLGIAAVIVGVAVSLGMPGGAWPFALFAALAVVLLVTLRARLSQHIVGDAFKGSKDEDFIGREVCVETGFDDVSPHRGRVGYRGASWEAKSEEAQLESGSFATITSREGNLLIISKER